MHFKLDWASLIDGSKLTVFVLFYFVFEGNFPSTIPRRAYTDLEGRFNRGFYALPVWGGGLYLEGLIFGILRYILFLVSSSVYASLGNSLASPATPIQLGQLYPSTVSPGLLLSK